eukprot:4524525-Pleurochrysis_carterae.AAC.1
MRQVFSPTDLSNLLHLPLPPPFLTASQMALFHRNENKQDKKGAACCPAGEHVASKGYALGSC